MRVDFTNCENATVENIFKYDYGQTLEISGVELPQSFEVHFETDKETAIVVNGTFEDGIGKVKIPDLCLMDSKLNFSAWIYVEQNGSGKTVKTITFYLKNRQAPSDQPSDPDEVEKVKTLAEYVKENADKVATAEKVGQDLLQRAENGEFDGKDYILTENDKTEIAEAIPVDTELSDTSTKPLQNKVVKQHFDVVNKKPDTEDIYPIDSIIQFATPENEEYNGITDHRNTGGLVWKCIDWNEKISSWQRVKDESFIHCCKIVKVPNDDFRFQFTSIRYVYRSKHNNINRAGYIYGKNMNETDLVLENVGKVGSNPDSGTVKEAGIDNASLDSEGQSTSYGISSKTGTACVRPYMRLRRSSDSQEEVVYGKMATYTYPNNAFDITVEYSDMGTIKLDGQVVPKKGLTVTKTDPYTLSAEPNYGVKFIGWAVNGKIVSTEAKWTVVPTQNITYVAVFEIIEDATKV